VKEDLTLFFATLEKININMPRMVDVLNRNGSALTGKGVMTMPDRENVLNALRCHANCDRGFDCGDCAYIGNGDCLDLLAMDAFALLKDQPEIVRCKDCKYFPDGNGSTNWLPCREIITPPGWFCADGERR
jgi:hypothetical protein